MKFNIEEKSEIVAEFWEPFGGVPHVCSDSTVRVLFRLLVVSGRSATTAASMLRRTVEEQFPNSEYLESACDVLADEMNELDVS